MLVYGGADSNERIGILILGANKQIFELVQECHNFRAIQSFIVDYGLNVESPIEIWHQPTNCERKYLKISLEKVFRICEKI